jgi:hypothetical protein
MQTRTEQIADINLSLLFVQRGTVIVATRDYEPLDFKQILQQHRLDCLRAIVGSACHSKESLL